MCWDSTGAVLYHPASRSIAATPTTPPVGVVDGVFIGRSHFGSPLLWNGSSRRLELVYSSLFSSGRVETSTTNKRFREFLLGGSGRGEWSEQWETRT